MSKQIQVTFNDHTFPLLTHKNDTWFSTDHIAACLEYRDGRKNVLKIFERNKSELEEHSVTVKLTATDGKQYDTRVFNEKGVMLITMFSKQPKAAEFRKWAIDVLSKYRNGQLQPVQQPLTLEPSPTNVKMTTVAPAPATIAVEQAEYIDLLKMKITFLEQQKRAPVRVNFTDEERAMVRQWVKQGVGHQTIGTRLGRTTDAVRGLIGRMKAQGEL